jgi:hypothetical protein
VFLIGDQSDGSIRKEEDDNNKNKIGMLYHYPFLIHSDTGERRPMVRAITGGVV